MQSTKLTAIAGLLASVVACSPKRAPTSVAVERPARAVTIQNNNWLDVVVYVVRNGIRQRLGTVSGLGTETLRLPSNVSPDGTVSFLLDPIGSTATHTMYPVYAGPGQRIEITVGSRLSLSTLAVWNQ